MQVRFSAFRSQSLAFMVCGLLGVAGLLVLYGRQYGWYEPNLRIYLVVPNSKGLRVGTPVRLSGLRVGVIEALALAPDGRVKIELRVPQRYSRWITPRSVASLSRDGLIGDWLVELTPAPTLGPPSPTTFYIATRSLPEIGDLVSSVESTRIDLQKLLVSTRRVADLDVPSSLKQLNSTLATGQSTSAMIRSEFAHTAKQIRATLESADSTARSATRTSTIAYQTLRQVGPDVADALQQTSAAMRRANTLLAELGILLSPVVRSIPADRSDLPAGPVDHPVTESPEHQRSTPKR